MFEHQEQVMPYNYVRLVQLLLQIEPLLTLPQSTTSSTSSFGESPAPPVTPSGGTKLYIRYALLITSIYKHEVNKCMCSYVYRQICQDSDSVKLKLHDIHIVAYVYALKLTFVEMLLWCMDLHMRKH
jgi:hypothetical protein